jgi:tetratricopeptide (TPR) repeat protein
MSEEPRSDDRLHARGPDALLAGAEASVDVREDHAHLLAEARILQQRGQWQEAIRRYRAVLAASPDHFGSLCGLAVSYGQCGERDRAVLLLRQAAHNAAHSVDAQLQVGAILIALDRADIAIPIYEAALSISAHHIDAHLGLANALLSSERPEAAIAHYHKALAIDPTRAATHHNIAAALERLGRLEAAASHYRQALATDPGLGEAHRGLGNVLRRLDRLEEAVGQYQRALAIEPDLAEVHSNLAGVLVRLGRAAEAVGYYERARAIKPDDALTPFNLGVAYEALGRPEDARMQYQHALALRPDLATAHNNLGSVLDQLGRSAEAIECYERSLARDPNFAPAHFNLGKCLQARGRHEAAAVHYEKVIAQSPDAAEAHNNLGGAYQKLGRIDEAIAHYARALDLSPDFVEALNNLGNAHVARGRLPEAVTLFERALAVRPDCADTHYHLGGAREAMGEFEDAGRAYERAIARAPARAEFHLALAQLQTFRAGDPRLDALEALAHDTGAQTEEAKIATHFALAKAYADLGRHQQSFDHLLEGNRRKRQLVCYDEAATLRLFEDIKAVFTTAVIGAKAGAGDPCTVPIFVVGMPRSGTTLIEQILASHSEVFAAGERDDFETAAMALRGANGERFPQLVDAISSDALRELGSGYVARLRAVAPTAKRIVDKMPSNFSLVGLIHLALPQARIIHVRRDPVDTCFSCFSLLFSEQPHTHDLGELGRYYRAYAALMAHWRAVLPPGVMLEVRYEDVVTDLEAQARAILAHCGLDWEDACLSFHRIERPVMTASAWQVRQPIYRNAVGRWRPYASALKPLLAALKGSPDGLAAQDSDPSMS